MFPNMKYLPVFEKAYVLERRNHICERNNKLIYAFVLQHCFKVLLTTHFDLVFTFGLRVLRYANVMYIVDCGGFQNPHDPPAEQGSADL